MRANYNRFLLTTCLSVMAVGAIGFTSARAGFEWTPPEKTAPVEVMPAPVDAPSAPMPSVTTDDVSSEELPPIEMNDTQDEEETPAIAITVMDDEEAEDADLSELQEAVDAVDNTDLDENEIVVQDIVATEEEAIVKEDVAVEAPIQIIEADPAEEYQEVIVTEPTNSDNTEEEVISEPVVEEEIIIEETIVEEAETQVEEIEVITQEAPATSTSLEINPYPEEQTSSTDTVVLPEDSEETLNDINSDDVVVSEEQTIPAQPAETITWNEPETFEIIEGFGSDMPLALALRQIVPPKYAFSFGEGVNPGTKVSWDGGKPWNDVLSDALAPLSIEYAIQNNKVLLKAAPQKAVMIDTQATVEELQKVVDDAQAALDEQKAQDFAEEEAIVEEEIEIIEVEPVTEEVEKTEEIQDSENDAIDSLTDSLLDENEHGHTQEDDVLAPADDIDDETLKSMATEENVTQATETLDEQLEIIEIIEEDASVIEKEKSPLDDIYGTPNETEEEMQPIEVNPDEEASAPSPLDSGEEKSATIQRQNVMDPGETESTQPIVQDMKEAVTETAEKKNELAENQGITDNALNEADDTALALAQNQESADQALLLQNEEAQKIEDLAEISPAASAIAKDVVSSISYLERPSNEIRVWEAKRGMNIQRILEKWQNTENIEIVWDTKQDYKLDKDIFISGTFQNAVDVLFSQGFKYGGPKHHLGEQSYTLHITD